MTTLRDSGSPSNSQPKKTATAGLTKANVDTSGRGARAMRKVYEA